jgi:hypothetical protein
MQEVANDLRPRIDVLDIFAVFRFSPVHGLLSDRFPSKRYVLVAKTLGRAISKHRDVAR